MTQLNEHAKRLSDFDQKLAELERTTRQVQEDRREYVNRHNLNKTNDAGYTRG